jgi:hypothetical protein
VALGEVDKCVENGWFRAVESGGSECVDNGGSEESAVQVMGLRHGRAVSLVLLLSQYHGAHRRYGLQHAEV